MSATLTYRHERADLLFTWNGGTQIMIRTGSTVPSWGVYPGRIDVREPDLWRSDLLPAHQRPPHRTGADVVLLPFTQEALQEACDAWWEGREITTGRDFAEHPWQTTVFGNQVDVRYRGGPVIEAAPARTGHWRTVVDLAADGRTPAAVTTAYLSRRIHGWSTGVLEHLGIHTPQPVPDPARYGDGTHDAITTWTIRNLPTQAKADSIIGAWHTWISNTVREAWAEGAACTSPAPTTPGAAHWTAQPSCSTPPSWPPALCRPGWRTRPASGSPPATPQGRSRTPPDPCFFMLPGSWSSRAPASAGTLRS
ncbi:hypothetical protein AB0B04_32275 [Streptomyces xinghaiensis]|uniref:Uncharacterized protein n=2 Tax=Streptomyces TaxID=1883 RepID=A0A3R7EJG3_9ACTN|nr:MULTISPECIES: hypothetical protein [Streptomyces]KNE80148.1 hypothetical protein ADZ36_23725 [Streptomyces fradiae]OFA50983.1 hypothetical protein BEN35_15280 [Streptomyces fradiae]PQM19518.1 hypothetical protein Sfr7A_31595 [Streptomyces xinghaiensis]RKM90942.1 hypothetical protein SFRA_030390 [Streptomyces xinghaiensis]RNC68943.1 hypothetical protein DC095_030635 [Streptomyces xinghaiensis]